MKSLTLASLGLALVVFALGGMVAVAGPLATNPNAYIDGDNVQWHGSTDFDDDGDASDLEGDGLEGNIDWAVFTAAAFNADYPDSGYIPPAGQMVYTYQVNVAGRSPLSSLSVGIDNEPTGSIGAFSGGGVTGIEPIGKSLSLASANFSFLGESILVGSTSSGLVYSSPMEPMEFFGSVIDGGSSAIVVPLPTPSSTAYVPEPATVALAGLALLLIAAVRRVETAVR
jgi:hypothetical protein